MQNINDNFLILLVIGMAGISLLVVSFILLHIRSQNRLLKQQQKIQEIEIHYRKELLSAVILSQEAERQRIGMDLHDEAGTALSSLRLLIEFFLNTLQPGNQSSEMGLQCKQIIDKVIANIRSIAHNLSPINEGRYSFTEAIEDLCDDINQLQQMTITLQWPETVKHLKLSNNIALCLYRVISELINNTIKHARADTVSLIFNIKDSLLLIDYRDDGIGLTEKPFNKGMGMRNIESRLEMIDASYIINGHTDSKGFNIQILLQLK